MKKILLFLFATVLILCCEKAPEEIAVSSVSIAQPTAEMIEGETVQLTAIITPSNATDQSVIWASSKQSVATVSEDGLVTAISEGQSTIIANAGGKSATCIVSVKSGYVAVSSISLDRESITLEEGSATTLIATVKPNDATDKNVTWNSSDTSVATVDNKGKVTAEKEGSSTITASIDNKTATCIITVVKDPKNNTIDFADIEIKAALLTHFDSNNDGELSYREAAAVSSIAGVFGNDVSFKSFDEFQFFSGVTIIPNNMFESWSQLKSIKLPDGILSIGDSAFRLCLSLEEISIPNKVKTIGEKAFQSCVRLKTVIIPQSVTGLAGYTFSGCSALESITLPDSIGYIGWGTFEDCKSLADIKLPEQLRSIGISAFQGSGLKSIIIPSSVTVVNNQAFRDCQQLQSVSFNNPKTEIEYLAFMNCTSLSNISLPSSIKSLEMGVFWGCSRLRTIDIPESVTKLDKDVFYGCTALKSIILPSSIVSIGEQSFYRCSNLETITVLSAVPPILGKEAFHIGLYILENTIKYPDKIIVPKECLDIYKKADGWKEYSTIIQAKS